MEVQYPIFVKDSYHAMYVFDSWRDMASYLDDSDFEEEEYSGWDALARPIEIFMDRGTISAKVSSAEPHNLQLREAIVKFAQTVRAPMPFVDPGMHIADKDLYEMAKERVMSRIGVRGALAWLKDWLDL